MKKKNRTEIVSEEINNNYSEMVQDTNSQIPEAQQTTCKRNKRMHQSETADHHRKRFQKQPGIEEQML